MAPAPKLKADVEPILPPVSSLSIEQAWRSIVLWMDAHFVTIAVAAGVGVLIYLLLTMVRSFLSGLKKRSGAHLGFLALLARVADKTGHIFMAAVAARLVTGYANPPAAVTSTVSFIFTLSAVFQGAIWLRELILGVIERRTTADGHSESLANAMGIIRLLVSVALFAIATVVVLDNLGVNVTGLVAGLGIGGIAIGLAAQGIFSDLFAALSIIFDKPFRTGETIQYETTTATVEQIGLKSTRLRAVTGEKKVISNANLLQKEITSYQALDRRRLKFPIGVIYQTAPALAARIPAILQEIIEAEGGTFVRSGFVAFGPSSLDFEAEFDAHLPNWDDIYAMRHRIGLSILARFAAEGIEFAYPTQTTFTAAPDGRMIMPYVDAPEPTVR